MSEFAFLLGCIVGVAVMWAVCRIGIKYR